MQHRAPHDFARLQGLHLRHPFCVPTLENNQLRHRRSTAKHPCHPLLFCRPSATTTKAAMTSSTAAPPEPHASPTLTEKIFMALSRAAIVRPHILPTRPQSDCGWTLAASNWSDTRGQTTCRETNCGVQRIHWSAVRRRSQPRRFCEDERQRLARSEQRVAIPPPGPEEATGRVSNVDLLRAQLCGAPRHIHPASATGHVEIAERPGCWNSIFDDPIHHLS